VSHVAPRVIAVALASIADAGAVLRRIMDNRETRQAMSGQFAPRGANISTTIQSGRALY
jgi:hypothetical protein